MTEAHPLTWWNHIPGLGRIRVRFYKWRYRNYRYDPTYQPPDEPTTAHMFPTLDIPEGVVIESATLTVLPEPEGGDHD